MTPKRARIIRNIAVEVCNTQQVEYDDESRDLSEQEILQTWGWLFQVTSRLARPLRDEAMTPTKKTSKSELKLYILSNLLDIVVNPASHLDQEVQHMYVRRILKLSSHIQKRLMAMAELRVGVKVSKTKTTPKKSSREVSTPPKYTSPDQRNGTPSSGERNGRRDSSGGRRTTPERNTDSPNTNRRLMNSSPNQTKENAITACDGTGSGYTPVTKWQNVRSPEGGFLSPGTLDSPQAIRAAVQSLQQKNKDLSRDLALAQQRELEFKTRMDSLKQNHRQDMIRLESASMEREQDLKRELEGQCKELQKKIEILEQESKNGRKAQEELAKARDELDVLGRNENEVHEMAERLRKYKDKISELHDLKEALKREQEAHSRSVEEIVRLESEVKVLLPAKRQLEEYKIRAIEAEVKLVESQDYLKRLEQQTRQATEASDSLFKETILQKEQMGELVKRINEETQANIDAAGKSVAEGVSELNPEIQQELVRLRNENLQLRAFAAKRQDDEVEALEAKLDDSQRLGAKFKEQYLETKESLAATQDELHESLTREENLQSQIKSCEQDLDKVRHDLIEVVGQKEELRKSLESMKRSHDSLQNENRDLRNEIQNLQLKLKETFELGTERLEQLQKVTEELSQVSKKLEKEQLRICELEDSVDEWKSNASELESHYEYSQNELMNVKSRLEDYSEELERKQLEIRNLNHEIKTLEEGKLNLQKQLESDRRSHNMALQSLEEQFEEERQSNKKSLEATKEILETKHSQEILIQSETMNNLLEEERKALKKVQEESCREIQNLIDEKKALEDEYREKLKQSQKELNDTVARLREESRAEIEAATKKARKESDANTNEIIKKGRDMINETKNVLKQEIEAIDEENRNLRDELSEKMQEYEDLKARAETREKDLYNRLEESLTQINSLTSEVDDTQERLSMLQREFRRVQEENDLYRRQVGGRFGVDSKLHAQFENLQKEYNTLLEENRQLKQQNRHNDHDPLGGIMEDAPFDTAYHGRGTHSRSTVVQVRREYEEAISALNDEKRELLMKHSAAVADVEKAEKRSWEREQENEKLKAELTSLKLALQRAELTSENQDSHVEMMLSPNQSSSFFSAREEEDERRQSTSALSPQRNQLSGYRSSPSIERAKRERAHMEQNFRNSLSSFKSSSDSPSKALLDLETDIPPPPSSARRSSHSNPPPVPIYPTSEHRVLSPTRKHDQVSNLNSPRAGLSHPDNSSFSQASPFLAKTNDSHDQPTSMFDYMERDAKANARDEESGEQECQQS